MTSWEVNFPLNVVLTGIGPTNFVASNTQRPLSRNFTPYPIPTPHPITAGKWGISLDGIMKG